MLSQNDTPRLSSDAKDYLAGLLGKKRGNTTTSSHADDETDDDEDDDVDVAHDEEEDEGDDVDDCSVAEVSRPGEESSSDNDYGLYWDNSAQCTPYLDHLSD